MMVVGYFDSMDFVSQNVSAHAKICNELNELYAKKNHDYGDSFHDTFSDEGLAASRVRLSDKLNRFKRLTNPIYDFEKKVDDESVRDTLIDLANYAIMTIIEIDRSKNWGDGFVNPKK